MKRHVTVYLTKFDEYIVQECGSTDRNEYAGYTHTYGYIWHTNIDRIKIDNGKKYFALSAFLVGDIAHATKYHCRPLLAKRSPCDVIRCPKNSVCTAEAGAGVCECADGFVMTPEGYCKGINCLAYIVDVSCIYHRLSTKIIIYLPIHSHHTFFQGVNPCHKKMCPFASVCVEGKCVCKQGFSISMSGKCVGERSKPITAQTFKYSIALVCLLSDRCRHVRCQMPNTRCQDGKCVCKDGFQRTPRGHCYGVLIPCARKLLILRSSRHGRSTMLEPQFRLTVWCFSGSGDTFGASFFWVHYRVGSYFETVKVSIDDNTRVELEKCCKFLLGYKER